MAGIFRNLLKIQRKDYFAIHIHDNSGVADEHLPVGEGTIKWEGIFAAIKELSDHCQLILEYAPNYTIRKIA